jgi:hypothetical protein
MYPMSFVYAASIASTILSMLTALNKANITHRTHSGIATSFRIARTPEDKNHV